MYEEELKVEKSSGISRWSPSRSLSDSARREPTYRDGPATTLEFLCERLLRVSLREAPSVSLYANYEPGLRLLGFSLASYAGARSGVVSLVGGRAFTDEATTTFTGETLQIGPVAGLVTDLRGMNLFIEGAYMSRDFKSVEWDSTAGEAGLPAQ